MEACFEKTYFTKLSKFQVVWHPHKDLVASCSYDNKVKLYKEDDDDWVRHKFSDVIKGALKTIAVFNEGNLKNDLISIQPGIQIRFVWSTKLGHLVTQKIHFIF